MSLSTFAMACSLASLLLSAWAVRTVRGLLRQVREVNTLPFENEPPASRPMTEREITAQDILAAARDNAIESRRHGKL